MKRDYENSLINLILSGAKIMIRDADKDKPNKIKVKKKAKE